MHGKFGIAGAMVAALCVTTSVEAQSSRIPGVRIVSSLVLADAAVAIADSGHPVIYINPRVFEEVGSEMAAFLLGCTAPFLEGVTCLKHAQLFQNLDSIPYAKKPSALIAWNVMEKRQPLF